MKVPELKIWHLTVGSYFALSRLTGGGRTLRVVNSAKGESMTTETLVHAVRDGIARTIAVIGLAGVALIHLLDLPGKFQETPYLGWLYVALILGCLAVAAARAQGPQRRCCRAGRSSATRSHVPSACLRRRATSVTGVSPSVWPRSSSKARWSRSRPRCSPGSRVRAASG